MKKSINLILSVSTYDDWYNNTATLPQKVIADRHLLMP